MRPPRRLLAAAAVDDKIYTFGGCGSPCFDPPTHSSTFEETRVEVYDPARNSWETKEPMSEPLIGAAAAAPGNGKIYVFGGKLTGRLTQEYDLQAGMWRKRRPMPTPRHGHTAVPFRNKLYVLGGNALNATVEVPSRALEIYDPEADTWEIGPPMPTARVFLAAAEVNGRIYAIGGSLDSRGETRADAVEAFDVANHRWEILPPPPIPLPVGASSGAVNGRIYVLGGLIPGSGLQKATLELDPTAGTWTADRAPVPTARDQAAAAVVEGRIYLLGGSINCHCSALGNNERYQPPGPALTCTKTGSISVEAGGFATYTIEIRNQGDAPATNVRLVDTPPAGLTLAEVGGDCTGLPCDFGTVAPGQEPISVDVTFRVADGCSAPSSITNVARVTVHDVEVASCSNSPPTSVLRPPPPLSCEKEGPDLAKVGDIVTYRVTVSNEGCAAATGVTVSDPAPPGLEYVSGPCVVSPCPAGTIGAGGPFTSGDIRFRVLPGCRESVVNLATVDGTNAPEASCLLETKLIPDLAVAVTAAASVSGGEELDIEVLVSNAGPSTARDVPLEVTLAGAASVILIPPGCESAEGRFFSCTFSEIGCSKSSEKRVFRVLAPPCPACAAPGPITATATLKVDDADPSNNMDSAESGVTCARLPDLTIAKEGPESASPGDELAYSISVKNVGCRDASTAVVADVFPAGLTETRWCREKDGFCTPHNAGDLLDAVPLAVEEEVVYRARGIVFPACAGTLLNAATVTPPPNVGDADSSNNSSTVETAVVPRPGVSAFCVSGCHVAFEGDAVTFTFVLLNGGPNAQADNPGDEFVDTLPAGLTLVSAAATSGTVATVLNTVSWNGAIPVCGTVTVTINATVDAGTVGMTLCNQATVFFDADGDGVNESNALSDDPDEPGAGDPCCLTILPVAAIPVLDTAGLAVLVLLLAGLALRRLRRRSA